MDKFEADILCGLKSDPNMTDRRLAEKLGCSLNSVSRSVKKLIECGYMNEQKRLTDTAEKELETAHPENAIILAAGFGARMAPINSNVPKALLRVKNEPLIERLIKQLFEVNIRKIVVVVGFMKEKLQYLSDRYGVNIIVNEEYATTNSLYSLQLAETYLSNAYIVPSDIWCAQNPFGTQELYSWYSVFDTEDISSRVRADKRNRLVYTGENEAGNTMFGIAYFTKTDAAVLRDVINHYCDNKKHRLDFWESAFYSQKNIPLYAKIMNQESNIEINTYEQLRAADKQSPDLDDLAMQIAAKTFHVSADDIKNIRILKKGMTNRSFLFECKGKNYIMRIPGEGTDQLIDRKKEAKVYQTINNKQLCDHLLYINPDNGYKITEYIENARTCDPYDSEDVKKCMTQLRKFHEMKLKAEHSFDLFQMILFYESLRKQRVSVFADYETTKRNVFSLKPFIDSFQKETVLTHIDAVPDNFLIFSDENGNEQIRLIDWEYAGMQDPHVDIAMFCIYSLYNENDINNAVDAYFQGNCDQKTRAKIYAYVAICGLLWSNWCEFKMLKGVEYGDYFIRQYQYAKDYYLIASEKIEHLGDD